MQIGVVQCSYSIFNYDLLDIFPKSLVYVSLNNVVSIIATADTYICQRTKKKRNIKKNSPKSCVGEKCIIQFSGTNRTIRNSRSNKANFAMGVEKIIPVGRLISTYISTGEGCFRFW